MTEARELTRNDYHQIMDRAAALNDLLHSLMNELHPPARTGYRIPDQWHQLQDWAKLGSVVLQAAHRASIAVTEPAAPEVPF